MVLKEIKLKGSFKNEISNKCQIDLIVIYENFSFDQISSLANGLIQLKKNEIQLPFG